MSDDLGKELRRSLHDAAKNRIFALLTTDEDRAAFKDIERRSDADRKELEHRYEAEYDDRVDNERQRLLDNAGKLDLDHPAPAGSSPVTKGEIERQAHRNVHLAHAAGLQRIREKAKQELDALLDRAQESNPRLQMFVDMATEVIRQRQEHFNGPERRSGIERRSGVERRGPSRSHE